MLDAIYIWFKDSLNDAYIQFEGLNWVYWLSLLIPFLWFADLPRYLFPSLVLLIKDLLFKGRDDSREKELFLADGPPVSICIIADNAQRAKQCMRTLFEYDYPNKEIIILDYSKNLDLAAAFNDEIENGEIKVVEYTPHKEASKVAATNLAGYFATGKIIVFADANATYDRLCLFHMIGAFHDQKVGAVAANVKLANGTDNLTTLIQGAEYLISINMWNRFLSLFKMNYLASGTLVAYRKVAFEGAGGLSPGLAPDADVSLKIKRAGYIIKYEPVAVALVNETQSLGELLTQRMWWDRGIIRTYINQHFGLLQFWIFHWRNFFEAAQELLFSIIGTFAFAALSIYLLWVDAQFFLVLYLSSMVIFMLASGIALLISQIKSERRRTEWFYFFALPLLPIYKEVLRWIRMYAMCRELLSEGKKDPRPVDMSWSYARKW